MTGNRCGLRFGALWLACFCGSLAGAQQQWTSQILYNFVGAGQGHEPTAGVVEDAAGNLYGSTRYGGEGGCGTVYKIDTSGQQTILRNFSGHDGCFVSAGLIVDAAGNLYGVTGGRNLEIPGVPGVVFEIDASGRFSILHKFPTRSPGGPLTRDSAGNLYGVLSVLRTRGGSRPGAAYKLDKAGKVTILHTFKLAAGETDPLGALAVDAAGNVYGTTSGKGGVVYKLNKHNSFTVLQHFSGGADGGKPDGVVMDSAGNLYGAAESGGSAGQGLVYKIDTKGKFSVLYNFAGKPDGAKPVGGLFLDATGNLYGTTAQGGEQNRGSVFRMDQTGKETVVHSFASTEGFRPLGGVILASSGSLYGTTSAGGSAGNGTVFEIDTAGHETILSSFASENGGGPPNSNLVRDAAGNLFGAAKGGMFGEGLIYKLDAAGSVTNVAEFRSKYDLGGASPPALDPAGNLYVTVPIGQGEIYKIDTKGRRTVFYVFPGGAEGSGLNPGLVVDSAGNIYGTTRAPNWGVAFRISPAGHETVLYTFTEQSSAICPCSPLAVDANGNVYGTTDSGGTMNLGTIFKLDKQGNLTLLHNFAGLEEGVGTRTGVTVDAAGNVYGTSSVAVFKIDTDGNFSVLHSFDTGDNVDIEMSGVILDAAGNLYGVFSPSLAYGHGKVFELDPAGNLTVLATLPGGGGSFTDPFSGLTFDPAGNLYGTVAVAGSYSNGYAYKLTPSSATAATAGDWTGGDH